MKSIKQEFDQLKKFGLSNSELNNIGASDSQARKVLNINGKKRKNGLFSH